MYPHAQAGRKDVVGALTKYGEKGHELLKLEGAYQAAKQADAELARRLLLGAGLA